jgi:hypothetical protein
MSHVKDVVEVAVGVVVGAVIGYKFAKSKFDAALPAAVTAIKKL